MNNKLSRKEMLHHLYMIQNLVRRCNTEEIFIDKAKDYFICINQFESSNLYLYTQILWCEWINLYQKYYNYLSKKTQEIYDKNRWNYTEEFNEINRLYNYWNNEQEALDYIKYISKDIENLEKNIKIFNEVKLLQRLEDEKSYINEKYSHTFEYEKSSSTLKNIVCSNSTMKKINLFLNKE